MNSFSERLETFLRNLETQSAKEWMNIYKEVTEHCLQERESQVVSCICSIFLKFRDECHERFLKAKINEAYLTKYPIHTHRDCNSLIVKAACGYAYEEERRWFMTRAQSTSRICSWLSRFYLPKQSNQRLGVTLRGKTLCERDVYSLLLKIWKCVPPRVISSTNSK